MFQELGNGGFEVFQDMSDSLISDTSDLLDNSKVDELFIEEVDNNVVDELYIEEVDNIEEDSMMKEDSMSESMMIFL